MYVLDINHTMPGPPPPPPPGGPPPPMLPAFTPPKGGPDDRSDLLKSIQKGAKLKKAVTNDKSAPIIGKVSNLNSNSTSSNTSNSDTAGSRSGGVSSANGVPMGLGGLFAGGMPKLKSTGLRSESPSSSSNNSSTSNHNVIPRVGAASSPSSNQRFNNIQCELKKQMLNNDNRTRGPPPPAPVRHLNNSEPHLNRNGSTIAGLSLPAPLTGISMGSPPTPNNSTLHRNAQSNLNLSTWNDSRDDTDVSGATRPVISHGKPNLAPRPPSQINGKPAALPKKLVNGKTTLSVNRAQSMRNSSNRQPTTPDSPDSGAIPSPPPKFGTVRHMPNATIGLSHTRSRPALNGRPTDPPPSIPTMPPPPPPPIGAGASPTVSQHSYHGSHGTPPPPSRTQGIGGLGSVVSQLQGLQGGQLHNRGGHSIPQAPSVPPPPPPHQRTLRQPPPPPVPVIPSMNSSAPAPPPPPRHSSMRDRPGGSCGSDFESRFQFHNTSEFPRPNNLKSLPKNYRGKSVGVKQPAPLPPASSMNYPLATNRVWDSTTS